IGPRCSRGTDDLQAPIGHVGRNNFVAARYGFELEVFGRDRKTAVLLDERARGTRTSSDIPAEIRCNAYEVVPAALGGGYEGELLRIACRTGGLDQSGEARGAAGVNAEVAVGVLERDGRSLQIAAVIDRSTQKVQSSRSRGCENIAPILATHSGVPRCTSVHGRLNSSHHAAAEVSGGT